MKTRNKTLLTLVCVVLLVVGSIIGTYAYLKSTPTEVVNTFTVGKVKIELDERDEDESKDTVTTEGRDKKNEYQMIPDEKYFKDPTVTVTTDSEKCWLFIKYEETNNTLYGTEEKLIQHTTTLTEANGWYTLNDETAKNVYFRVVEKNADVKSWVLLEEKKEGDTQYHIMINKNLTNETMPGTNVDIKNTPDNETDDFIIPSPELKFYAYAIQYAGFEAEDESIEAMKKAAGSAWAELNGSN